MSETPALELKRRREARQKLGLLVLLCLAPIVASYLAYYVFRPGVRSNYGELIEPQRPVPPLELHTLDGRPFALSSLEGRWLMVMVDGGACGHSCPDKLYHMRQVRLTTGKDRERVERVWLISDAEPLSEQVMHAYDGTLMLRARPDELRSWLPVQDATAISDHIYIVDPHGHLMMRFPKDADPNRTKRDLARLLAASSIG